MKIEINIVKTFYNFGHKVFKNSHFCHFYQDFGHFLIRILAISYGKYLTTLSCATNWPTWNVNAAR